MAEAFLRLSADDRRDVLGIAADRSGRPTHLLEKDVWVQTSLHGPMAPAPDCAEEAVT